MDGLPAFTVAVFGWGMGFYGPLFIWSSCASRAAGRSHSGAVTRLDRPNLLLPCM